MEIQINSANSLEAIVGKTQGPRDLKVIDFLDKEALRWISASTCLAISRAASQDRSLKVVTGAGESGFIIADSRKIFVPRTSMDYAEVFRPGDGFGSIFLIPALRESLRVNGKVSVVSDSGIQVEVSECYLHCAKAFMRSKMWEEYAPPPVVQSIPEFIEHCRFMFIATCDGRLRADVSPRGDPAGQLLQFHDNRVWWADRPGNRRVDGFRNILENPQVELTAVIPGGYQVLRVTGKATLFSKHTAQSCFEVDGKVPSIVAGIEPESIAIEDSATLGRARLWPPTPPNQKFRAADIWQGHMKQSQLSGIEATLAKTAASIPGAIDQFIKWDYKNNLY